MRRKYKKRETPVKVKKRLRRSVESASGKIPAVDCLEESFHVLRVNCFSLLPIYCLGTIPFVLGVIYFINDMCQRSDAKFIVPEYAFFMALLFLWKNFFQTLFCGKLMDKLTMRIPQKLIMKDYLKILLYQGIVQPIFLFINIFSIFLFFPLPYTTSFFNTFMAITGSERVSLRKNLKASFYNTLFYPAQNSLIFLMLMVLGFITMLNCGMVIFILPWLLKTFLGVDTFFAKANGIGFIVNLIFNSTFWSVIFGVVYLVIDPLVKTAYTIRMFYAESIFKGFDILSSLQRIRGGVANSVKKSFTILLLITLPMASLVVSGETVKVENQDPVMVNNKIEKVLQRREYSWRLPSEELNSPEINAFSLFFEKIFNKMQDFIDAIDRMMKKFFSSSKSSDSSGFGSVISWVSANSLTLSIILLIIIMLSVFIITSRRRRNIIKTAKLADVEDEKSVDLLDENITADSLKNSEWLNLAREMIAKGELRLALRAIFLASIATLADKGALSIAKYKTNMDYLYEIRRRHHTSPDEVNAFYQNVKTFENIWYGSYKVDQALLDAFRDNFDIINDDLKKDYVINIKAL